MSSWLRPEKRRVVEKEIKDPGAKLEQMEVKIQSV
jgi:hypothetical protein